MKCWGGTFSVYAGRLKDEGSKCGWKGSMKNATGSSLGVVILFGSLGAMQKGFFISIIFFTAAQ